MNEFDEQLLNDIRAEIYAANLIENSEETTQKLGVDDFIIQPIGAFKRSYSRDVIKTKEKQFAKKQHKHVYIKINRDGLYDHLPEGIFHEHYTGKGERTLKQSEANIKQKKKEEQAARTFFLPFEQEFYRQRLIIELEERAFLKGFLDKNLLKMFLEYWGLSTLKFSNDPDKNDLKAAALLNLLPYCSDIAGNLKIIENWHL